MCAPIDICAGTQDQWAQIKGSARRRVTRELQGDRCYLCGDPFLNHPQGLPTRLRRKLGVTEDHVTPRADGARTIWNILLAHQGCNSTKSSRAPYPCELIMLASVNLGLRRYRRMRMWF